MFYTVNAVNYGAVSYTFLCICLICFLHCHLLYIYVYMHVYVCIDGAGGFGDGVGGFGSPTGYGFTSTPFDIRPHLPKCPTTQLLGAQTMLDKFGKVYPDPANLINNALQILPVIERGHWDSASVRNMDFTNTGERSLISTFVAHCPLYWKTAIATLGAIAIPIDASSEFFVFYKDGNKQHQHTLIQYMYTCIYIHCRCWCWGLLRLSLCSFSYMQSINTMDLVTSTIKHCFLFLWFHTELLN